MKIEKHLKIFFLIRHLRVTDFLEEQMRKIIQFYKRPKLSIHFFILLPLITLRVQFAAI